MTDTARDILLLEYERSSEFCNHVDDVRNILTSFFLTATGGAVVVLGKYFGGGLNWASFNPTAATVLLTLLVAMIGTLFVGSLARLRRVQLERYLMMDRILDYCLSEPQRSLISFQVDSVTGLGSRALKVRAAGSYFWSLAVMLPASLLYGLAALVAFSSWTAQLIAAVVALLTSVGGLVLHDLLHHRLAAV